MVQRSGRVEDEFGLGDLTIHVDDNTLRTVLRHFILL